MLTVIVVGAGINGVTSAIELKKRGHKVVLVDPGPLPHPLAASTDISKAVRAAYGPDEDYTALAAEQTGDKENASRYYAKLTAQTAKSDGGRDELNRIRKYRTADASATAQLDNAASAQ